MFVENYIQEVKNELTEWSHRNLIFPPLPTCAFLGSVSLSVFFIHRTNMKHVDNLLTWLNEDASLLDDPYYDITHIHTDKVFNVSVAFPKANVLYPFSFENNFNSGGVWSLWSRANIHVPFICVLVYLFVVFSLKSWMSTREKFHVTTCWKYWNTMLSIFSWWGALRLVPHIFSLGYHQGIFYTYCGNAVLTYGPDGASGLWTGLFIFSKIPELIDTVFIVLGKSQLHFLQWYHHVTVLLYTWHSYATRSGAGIWFIAMNYSVHACMYMYFACMNVASERKDAANLLKNTKEKEKALSAVSTFKRRVQVFALPVTLMQISQMFVGIAVMFLIYRDSQLFSGDKVCYVRRASWFSGLLMYGSYFALFVIFAINKYCLSSSKSGIKPAAKKSKSSGAPSVHKMATRSRNSATNAKDKDKTQ